MSIQHFCSECGNDVTEFCSEHPNAQIDSIQIDKPGAKFTCTGSVRGNCGVQHKSRVAAEKHIEQDHKGCKSQGGYSDRVVVELQ